MINPEAQIGGRPECTLFRDQDVVSLTVALCSGDNATGVEGGARISAAARSERAGSRAANGQLGLLAGHAVYPWAGAAERGGAFPGTAHPAHCGRPWQVNLFCNTQKRRMRDDDSSAGLLLPNRSLASQTICPV